MTDKQMRSNTEIRTALASIGKKIKETKERGLATTDEAVKAKYRALHHDLLIKRKALRWVLKWS